jgi:CRISPR/Cas system CMR subunit Cmr6 (Cas7 group RAMP superfamily)
MKKIILIVSVVAISFAFLHADVYIKQKTSMGAMMGQPPKEVIQEHWLGKNKMAMISLENSMILDMEAKKLYMVIHGSKSYIETGLPLDMIKLMPEQAAQMMKGMMEGMTIDVQPNGQTKKVGNWNASGYDVKITVMGMEMKMTFWASKDVPFDWKKYSDLYSELYKAQFRMGEKFIKEFKKVQGFPVATEMDLMGMKITSTTEEISEKKPDAATYSVPAGYTKKDKLSMQDMQQR